MTKSAYGDPINRLAKIMSPGIIKSNVSRKDNRLINRMSRMDTLLQNNIDYNAQLAQMNSDKWLLLGGSNERAWYWQTCTEFGYYQSTDMGSTIFGSTVSAR